MSKRYIENFPDWLSLLEEYWIKLDNTTNFYSYLSALRKQVALSKKDASNEEINFIVNAQAAAEIQKRFDESYN
ncbi:hypothetical protein FKV76_03940 [Weissella paramesenteroides]|nr:hypothetical protein FKV76_03940 [Weissella paramesenteroides]